MARGSEEKIKITNDILAAFPGAFVWDKEIRIPIGDVQIKCVLTCAKDNVNPGGDEALPGAEAPSNEVSVQTNVTSAAPAAPTQEELDNVATLLSSLGL